MQKALTRNSFPTRGFWKSGLAGGKMSGGVNPKWMGDRTVHRLKLSGYASADAVSDVFDSSMIDVAYIESIQDDGIIIFADDPNWPADEEDYEWLCSQVTQSLADTGLGTSH